MLLPGEGDADAPARPRDGCDEEATVMTGYADLEVGLHRRDAVTYGIELRFALPSTDAETRLDVDGPLVASIDTQALDALDDDDEYGRLLGRDLFGGGFGAALRTAVATSQSQGVRLRVRLVVGPSASSLHGLRWETLRDPADDSVLAMNENVLLSRYLSSNDWRPVGVLPRGDLRALTLVASPTNLGAVAAGRPLAALDVPAELERARTALGGMHTVELPGAGRPTAAGLVAQLREGVDMLYLVCHGYVANDEPVLLLEDEDGTCAPLLGSELVDRIRELSRPPRLVFLASCQSAGAGEDARSDDAGVLAALGPRLATAGVPAIVAMQGNITTVTASTFAQAFFQALDEDGLVDRAAAVARSTVRDRPDWWAPALFMRLRSGRLWYSPGSATGDLFEKWPAVIGDLRRGRCTPIIGPGMSDVLLGSRQEIARSWARSYRFPMAPHARESLPQVAQYLAVNQSPTFPLDELEDFLRRRLVQRYGDQLSPDLVAPGGSLEALIAASWRVVHDQGSTDPYTVLAQLPVPVYITTQPSQLLSSALEEAGRIPEVEICRWRDGARWPESVFDRDPDYTPSPERPLVYHLLGAFSVPDSLVLTEDDYFDFLIGVTQHWHQVPSDVKTALTNAGLMFLGFRLDEWDFRVLYRSVMNAEGRDLRKRYANVAVQVDPEEVSTLDVDRARRYLESYFDNDRISIFWGSTDNFVKELHDQWRKST
ncbi:MAG: CHAT domain-containing protein [Cellulomonas sp.]